MTWRRVRKIPVLTEAALLTLGCRLALTLLPFAAVRKLLPRHTARAQAADPVVLTAAVARVSKFIPQATCLTQALAGYVLLARHGIASEVHIGVKKDETKFHAHAWLAKGERV